MCFCILLQLRVHDRVVRNTVIQYSNVLIVLPKHSIAAQLPSLLMCNKCVYDPIIVIWLEYPHIDRLKNSLFSLLDALHAIG